MPENTQVPGGDIIRSIDRGAAKTQVMQLDVGGGAPNPEQLVDALNRLPVVMEEVTLLLSAILEKMPRVDTADRLMVSGAEVTQAISISANQDIRNVTGSISGSLGNVLQFGGREAGQLAATWANAGAMHLYDNIRVT